MNAPVLLAQLLGSSAQTPSPPKNIKLEKPQTGAAVTVHLDGQTQLDFSDVASEKLTFVRVGDKLIVLFDNQSTVTVDPVFGSDGHPLANILFEMAPDRTLTGDQFASLFPITTDQSVLPAAGPGGNGPTSGAHFGDPTVDPLSTGTPLDLLGAENNGSTLGAFVQPAGNPTPIPGVIATVTVNEDALPGGNPGAPGVVTVTGSLNVNFGTDTENRSFSFAATQAGLSGLTSDGQTVHLFVTTIGGLPTMIGYVGTDPSIVANEVFTVSLNANATIEGTYTFTLLRPLDHPILGVEDTLDLSISVIATDRTGDTAPTVINVNVVDNAPIIVAADETHSTLTDPVTGAVATSTGSLGISWGADNFNDHVNGGVSATTGKDGDRAVVFSDTVVTATGEAGGVVSSIASLTSNGAAVHYVLLNNGTELVAYTGNTAPTTFPTDAATAASEHVVFTVSLSDASNSGNYVISQYQSLDHNSGTTLFDSIDLSFHYTATDSDGDPVSATLTATIDDTVPTVTESLVTHSTITDPVIPADATATGTLGITWGADSANATIDGGILAADGDRAVIFTNAAVTATGSASNGDGGSVVTGITGLTSENQAVHYVLLDNGTVLVAYTGDTAPTTVPTSGGLSEGHNGDSPQVPSNVVFVVTLTDASATGGYTVTQYQPLDHTADGTKFDSINLTFNFTAVDSDGDTATGTLTVTVDDTIPVITGTVFDGNVGEEALLDGNHIKGDTVTTTATASLGIDWGADNEIVTSVGGFGRTLAFLAGDDSTAIAGGSAPVSSLALSIAGEQGSALSSGGVALVYTVTANPNGGETLTAYQGSTSGSVIFTLSLDPTANNGSYTFTLDGPLDNAAGSNSIALTFTVQATDADGDAVQQHFTVDVQDDVPVVTGAIADQTVGEEGLATSNHGIAGEAQNASTGVVSLNIAWGADDNNSGTTNNRTVAFAPNTISTLQGMHLTSDGHSLSYAITTDSNGEQLLTATTGTGKSATAVFTVQLSDLNNGSYDFTLLGNLDHPVGQGANEIAFTFNVVGTDDDGDTVNQSFTVNVQDDVPVAGIGTAESVKEANLSDGSSPDLHDLSVTGSLNVAWGADGNDSGSTNNRSISFQHSTASADVQVTDSSGNTITGLTSNGHIVQFGIFNGVLVGYVNNDPAFEKVFTVSLNDDGSGSYTFTLLNNLDHPAGTGNNTLNLTFDYTATDSDGDPSSNTFTVTVVDDVPTAHVGDSTTINEANLPNGNQPLFFGLVNPSVSGDLNIVWGADNNNSGLSNNRSVTFQNNNAALDVQVTDSNGHPIVGLTSDGATVNYAFLNGVLVGYTGNNPHFNQVFTVSLNDNGDGSYTFTLLGNLDHPTGQGTNLLNFTFDYTATDSDGDPSSSTFTVSVKDSVPLAFGGDTAYVDEDDLPSGTSPHASALSDTESLNIAWGADDNNTGTTNNRSVAFTNTSVGVSEGFHSLSSLTSDGEPVHTTLIGGVLVGYIGSAVPTSATGAGVVFNVSLSDSGDGSYTFTLLGNLDHPNDNGQNTLELTFNYTATDSDGDTASNTFTVDVKDDVPVVTGGISTHNVGEDGLAGANVTGGSFDAVDNLTTGAISLNVNWGADNAISSAQDSTGRTLTFNVSHNHGVITPLDSQGHALNLTSDGVALQYVITTSANGTQELDAYKGSSHTSANLVFSVVLDPTAAHGTYDFTLAGNLDHPASGSQDDNLLLNFGITATDSDGDSVAQNFTVDVQDDVPTIGTPDTETVAESTVNTPFSNAFVAAAVTGSLAVNWGADNANPTSHGGAHDRSLQFSASLDHFASGLTSNGEAITYTLSNNGTLLTATVSSGGPFPTLTTVFTVSLNDSTGAYTFTLLDNLDQPAPASGANKNDLPISFGFTATDSDGDTASGSFTVNVQDDVPVVLGAAQTGSITEALLVAEPGHPVGQTQTTSGSLDIDWNADSKNAHLSFVTSSGGAPVITDGSGNALTLTSGGVALDYVVRLAADGTDQELVAYKHGDPAGAGDPVFIVTLNAPGSPAYVFGLFQALDHPIAGAGATGADTLSLNFTVNAIDGDGDTVQQTFAVNVLDSVPVVAAVAAQTVGEEGLPGANTIPNDAHNASTGDVALNINWGADNNNPTSGSGAHDRSVTFASSTIHDLNTLNLTSHGQALTYVISQDSTGALLTASAGGHTVFTVQLSDNGTDGTGSYNFKLLDNLDHPAGQGANFENLTFNVVATDSDGDTAAQSFTVNVQDDLPVIGTQAATTVLEHALVSQPNVADSVSGSLGINFGADGPGPAGTAASTGTTTHTYTFNELSATHAGSVPEETFTFQTDSGGVIKTGGNGELYGNQITITNGGAPFTMSSIDLGINVPGDGSQSENIKLIGTDIHGNKITDVVQIHNSINVGDTLSFTYDTTGTKFDGVQLTSLQIASPSNNFNGDVIIDNFVVDTGTTTTPGTPGPVAFTDLTTAINNIAIVDQNGNSVSAATLTSHGDQVHYELLDSATLVAYTGSAPTSITASNVVFSVVLSQDPINNPNGGYTFTLDKPLDDLPASVTDLKFTFGFTATDFDGDSTPGQFTVNVQDDLPVIGTPDSKTVLEDTLVSQPSASMSGSLGVSFGADGPAAVADGTIVTTPHSFNFTNGTNVGAGFSASSWIATGGTLEGALGAPVVFKETDGHQFLLSSVQLGLQGTPTGGVAGQEVLIVGLDANGVAIPGVSVLVNIPTLSDGTSFTYTPPAGSPFASNEVYGISINPVTSFAGQVYVDNLNIGSVTADNTHTIVSAPVMFANQASAVANVSIVDNSGVSHDASLLTSHGQTVHYELLDAVTLVAYTGSAPTSINASNVVFSVVLSENGSNPNGAYDFTLYHPLDDLPASVTDLKLSFNFTATDGDGDTTPGQFTVDVHDDVPTLVAQTPVAIVDGNFAGGSGDYPGAASFGAIDTKGFIEGWSYAASPVGGATQVELEHVNNGYDGAFSTDGSAMVDLEASPGNIQVSQSITGLTAGEHLLVSFEIGEANFGNAKLEVLWDGQEVGVYNPQNGQMQIETIGVTGNGTGNDTLTFEEIGVAGDNTGTYLTDVSAQQVAGTVYEAGLNDTVAVNTTINIPGGGTFVETLHTHITGTEAGAANAPTTASGSLASLVNFGADGPAMNGNAANGFELVPQSNGAVTTFLQGLGLSSLGSAVDHGTLVGDTMTAIAADGHNVFTLTVNGDGTWTFNLLAPLNDAHLGADSINLDFSSLVKAVDFDGDSIGLGAGTFTVAVVDDVPVVTGTPAVGTVSETDLSFTSIAVNPLLISYGADGESGHLSFAVDSQGNPIVPAGLTSGGVALSYVLETVTGGEQMLVAYRSDESAATPVFEVTLNSPGTPVYIFSLSQPLDHDGTLPLTFTVNATDGDGDTVQQSFTVDVQDSVPTIGTSAVGDVSEDGPLTLTNAPLAINWGADNGSFPGSHLALAFTDSVVTATDPNGTVVPLTSYGHAISIEFIGGELIGYTGTAPTSATDSNVVFTATLSAATGTYDFTLNHPLDNVAPVSGNDSLNLTFDITATDSDGSQATGHFTVNVDAAGSTSTAGLLDYSNEHTGVFVNLTDSAFATAGQIVQGHTATDATLGGGNVIGIDTLGSITDVTGGSGNDILLGGNTANTIHGGDGNDLLIGFGGNDTLFGDAGNDTFVYSVGDGRDVVDGGTGIDTQIVDGVTTAETFNINAIDPTHLGINIVAGTGIAAHVLATTANAAISDTNVEEILINLSTAGDTVVISGDLSGTGVATNTITINGSSGNDLVDLSTFTSNEDVVFDGAGNGAQGDTVILGFAFSAATAYAPVLDSNGHLIGVEITYTSADGPVTDTFTNVEHFQFSDQTLSVGQIFPPTAPTEHVLVADTAAVDAGTVVVSGNALTGVTDIDGGTTLSVTAINGSTVGVGHDVAGTYGTLELNSDGTYSYTANAALDALPAGAAATDTFQFTVTDSDGGATTTALKFNITGAADTPVVNEVFATVNDTTAQDANTVVLHGNLLTDGGLDTDRDTGTTLSVTMFAGQVVSGPGLDFATDWGTIHVNTDGSYTFTGNAALDALKPGDQGGTLETFTVTSSDGGTASSLADFTIKGAADTPVVNAVSATVADTAAVNANTVVVHGNLLTDGGLDTDRDTGATLSVTMFAGQVVAGPGLDFATDWGTIHVNTDGSYTFTGNAALDALRAGDQGGTLETFTVTSSDGGTASTLVDFTITGAADTPVVTSGATGTEAEGTATSHVVYQAVAAEADTGATLTYSLSGTDAHDFTVSSTGAVTFDSAPNYETQHTFNIEVDVTSTTDVNGTISTATASQAVTINVTPVDNGTAPLTITDSTQTITAPTVGDVLHATLGTDPDGGPTGNVTYTWFDNGQQINGATGANYTVAASDVGDTITVSASYVDAKGFADTANSGPTQTVISGDAPPVIKSFTNGTVFEGDGLGPNVGNNLILNGGFESQPAVTSWTVTNNIGSNFSITPAHSGLLALGFGQGSETLSQNVTTVADGIYTVDFFLANAAGSTDSFTAMWNGVTLGTPIVNAGPSGYTEYTYTEFGNASSSQLSFAMSHTGFFGNGNFYWELDDVSVKQVAGIEGTTGTVTFTDADSADTHTVTATADHTGYIGTFTPTLTTDSHGGGTGAVTWTYTVSDALLAQTVAPQTSITQSYTIAISDGHGGITNQDVSVTLTNPDHAPMFQAAGTTNTGTVSADLSQGIPAGNLLTNGGFETGNLTGWSQTGTAASFTPASHSGNDAAGFGGTSTLSQTFASVIGVEYTLTFFLTSTNNPTLPDSFSVSMGGVTLDTLTNYNSDPNGFVNYQEFTFNVLATSANTTVTFSFGASSNSHWLLDDVNVQTTPGLESTFGQVNFTDADTTDTHTVSVAANNNLGTFNAVMGTDSTGGQTGIVDWTYSVSDADLATLTAHDQLTETYTVLVSDGRGGTLSENVVVTVDGPQNQAPVFTSTALGSVTEYATPGATSDQLVNGGFDLSPVGTGWTQTVTSGIASISTFFPDNNTHLSWNAGNFFGSSVPTDASIGQSIATSSGAQYQLNFSLVAYHGNSADLFEVLWNGQVVDTINANQADTGGYGHYSVTVTGTGGNDQLLFVADDANGNATWLLDTVSLVPTAPLPSIEKTSGTLTFTDANVSDSHTVTQAAPTFSLSGGGVLTQAEIDAVTLASSLTLTETDSRGTGSGSVAWSYQVPDSALQFLSTGQTLTETYAVTVTDVHGAATSQNVVITIHGTTTPQVTSEAITGATGVQNNLLNAGDVVSVTVNMNEVVNVTGTPQLDLVIGGTMVQANYASGSGSSALVFTYTIQGGQTDTNGISIGSLDLSNGGTITDLAGKAAVLTASAADNANYMVDTTAPTETISSTIGTVTGATTTISSGGVTKDNTLVLSGTVSDANGVASVQVFDGTTLLGTATVTGGNWSFTTAALADGSHSFTAKATDNAGNTTTTSAVTATVDTTAPAETISSTITTNSGATGTITSGGTTKDNTLKLSGTVSDAYGVASVQVFDGSTLLGTATVTGGNWSFTTAALGSGSHSFTAKATDNAGNTTTTSAVMATVDTTAPTLTSSTPADNGNITRSANIVLNFSEAMSAGAGTITLKQGSSTVETFSLSTGQGNHGGSVSISGSTVTIDPGSKLSSNSAYDILISSNALTDLAGNAYAGISSSTALNFSTGTAPAGASGAPINLALTDYSDHSGLIAATITGLAAGWILSEGIHNADGSWTVQTNDIGALSVTSPDGYVGALVLNVSESWTNADGTHGTATVADNVEAYAKGSPIFAWSGDDTLTASIGSDTLVFANKIGNDVVHNFDTMHDKIDLVGFNGFASFADVQAHLGHDASGNAVITLADGETITLNGVAASSLNAGDFEFDQTPVTYNTGDMVISDGALLPLSGVIDNTGSIHLSSAGSETDLEIVQHGATLQGGGTLVLSDNAENIIFGSDPSVTLTNVDNTISGAGHLGDGQMTLVNEGSIIADGINALDIDTGGNTIVNSGTLEATGAGGLTVHSDLANDGLLWANGGNVTLDGDVSGHGSALISGNASLEIGGAFSEQIQFDDNASGTLKIDNSVDFHGILSGFGSHDAIDLGDILASTASLNYTENAAGTGGTLTVNDGSHAANIAFAGQYAAADFHIASDSTNHVLIQMEHQAHQVAAAA